MNLDGWQAELPKYYKLDVDATCVLEAPDLKISEILPNPTGVDTGNEFIEFYNPGLEPIELDYYKLTVGTKDYAFPSGATIQPGAFAVWKDTDLGFKLPNSNGTVFLRDIQDHLVDQTATYATAPDGESFAVINNIWQFTNQPTPKAENKMSVVDEGNSDEDGGLLSGLKPCAANQYRSAETNRCRLIKTAQSNQKECLSTQFRNPETGRCKNKTVNDNSLKPCEAGKVRNPETNRCRSASSTANSLKPCDPGQIRNPETNRCRSLVASASSLKPCKAGQVRNPETNRCRSTTTANELKPCAEGQVRNPDTNRCRKASANSEFTNKVEDLKSDTVDKTGWWVYALVVVGVLVYAIWLWRRAIVGFFEGLRRRAPRKKTDS